MTRRLFPILAALCLPASIALADDAAPKATPDVLAALHLKSCRLISPEITPARTAAPSITPSLSLTIDLGDPAAPHPVTFLLDPYPLRSPAFKVIVSTDAGDIEVPAPAPSTFHATDAASGDEILASVINGRLRATILPGRADSPVLYVQPLSDAKGAAEGIDGSLHALYAATDIAPLNATCGVDDCAQCQAHAATTPAFIPRGPGTCKYAELIADCDYPFFQSNGSSIAACVQDVEVVMLGVNALYRNTAGFTPPVRFALKQVTIRSTNAADPYNALPVPPTEADSGTLLTTELNYWNAISSTTPDIVHLFTGRDLNGATVGLAYVNVVCSSARYSLVQSRFTANLGARYQDSAHEIGHNFSFSHDDVNGTNIMNSGINAGAPATVFSSQSVSQYLAAIGGFTCLNNSYPDVLADYATTLPSHTILIDVLANDGQGVICTSPITTFTLFASSSSLGGALSVSTGTGPGGRDQIMYTTPPGAVGVEDSFTYYAGGVNVPVFVTIATPRPPDQPYSTVLAGLTATYYDITSNNGTTVGLFPTMPALTTYPVFGTGVATQLNYPPSTGNAVGSSRNFGMGAIFTGFIQVPVTELYQFWTVSDDLSRVWIGSTVVVTNGSVQTVGEATGSIALAPGRHAITVEYTNYTGNTQLALSYAYPGQPRTTVPASALWRAAGPCHADFNGTASVSVQDIFDFLGAWFAGQPRADFNGVNGVTVQDIFDFLTAWFGPC
jgi:hypothetical protein